VDEHLVKSANARLIGVLVAQMPLAENPGRVAADLSTCAIVVALRLMRSRSLMVWVTPL
jgi:hypothetical protein